MSNWTLADIEAYEARRKGTAGKRGPATTGEDTPGGGITSPGPSQTAKTGVSALGAARTKHGNKPTTRSGIRFDSVLEADYYDYLRVLKAAGEVAYFLRQVPIELLAGVTYRVDFLVVFTDGRLEYHEAKGHITDVSRIKMRQAEALYPITLRVVRRGDFPKMTP